MLNKSSLISPIIQVRIYNAMRVALRTFNKALLNRTPQNVLIAGDGVSLIKNRRGEVFLGVVYSRECGFRFYSFGRNFERTDVTELVKKTLRGGI